MTDKSIPIAIPAKPNFCPRVDGTQFTNKYDVTNERVTFVPDVDIHCQPPYVRGKVDSCWVKYRNRPTTKEAWERVIGMSIQTMV